MEVLWLINSRIPDDPSETKGVNGPWMRELLSEIVKISGLQVYVASLDDKSGAVYSARDNLVYKKIYVGRRLFGWWDRGSGLEKVYDYVKFINPDVIHIHGSEGVFLSLANRREMADKIVISMQGIISEYAKVCRGNIGLIELMRATGIVDMLRGRGLFYEKYNYESRGKREINGLARIKYVLGRTFWDKSFIRFNGGPGSVYFYSSEMIREEFYREKWDLRCIRRGDLIFTNASGPIKGVEVLLEAVSILIKAGLGVRLKIAGRVEGNRGYSGHLKRKIKSLNLDKTVTLLGYLGASEMAEELARSEVFVSASYLDNSPNSVCEAQIVGTPVVSSHVGGISSLVENDKTGILVSRGDAFSLASAVARLLTDDDLKIRLSVEGRAQALDRHDRSKIVASVVGVYNIIASQNEAKN